MTALLMMIHAVLVSWHRCQVLPEIEAQNGGLLQWVYQDDCSDGGMQLVVGSGGGTFLPEDMFPYSSHLRIGVC